MREVKFRCWNNLGQYMHHWDELVRRNKIHLLDENSENYPVMQYTGLKDSNGVEIYEGDIIEAFGSKLLIHWEDSDASFFATSSDGFISESGQEWQGNCFVIGNIYQNPELME